MINKDGGETIFRFYGGHSCYDGGNRAHGGPPVPPTRENPAMSTSGGYLEYIGGC